MLSELKVSHFAIIDDISVCFRSGFNVLSGETGSGKSVLLKSLALLMGDKSTSDIIRNGFSQAVVEGSFDITARKDIKARLLDSGFDLSEDILIVKRIISQDGKNRVYLNGSLSALQQLKDIVAPLIEVTSQSAPLIEMTSQHENRHLQSKSFHLEALDQYLGVVPLRREVEQYFQKKSNLQFELEQLIESNRSKTQRLDFLIYQRDEIKGLGLKAGDEFELEKEARLLRDSTKLIDFVNAAEAALYSDDDSALVRLHRVIQKGQEFSLLDKQLATYIDSLVQAKTQIEEAVYGLRDHTQNINSDSTHIELVEEKLSHLRKLQKKYGNTVAEILEALVGFEAEILALSDAENRIAQFEDELKQVTQKLFRKAKELHKARLGGSTTLAKSVNSELDDLNMKGLVFSIKVVELEPSKINSTGMSDIEFMIQSSKKDSARSLAKFASGGELSRILLSLKRVVGLSDFPRTYLFDEVDAGVSGVTAEKVGRKLKSIAKGQQVISVTHLPQVAAFADAHFVINKISCQGHVKMTVEELDDKEKVKEIARMLSGEKITKSSVEHAKELLSVQE